VYVRPMRSMLQWFSQLDEFNWLSRLLRICIQVVAKKLYFFFYIWVSKKNHTDFKSVELIGNKCTNNKLFAKNFYKLVIQKRTDYNFAPFFFSYSFFVFFSTVSKSAQNNELFWNQKSNFVKKQFLGHISTFVGTLKPNSQETTQNFEKRILQKCSYGTVHFFSSVWS
jgi:hypothetical protein